MQTEPIKVAERTVKEHTAYKKIQKSMIISAKNSNFSGHLKLLRQNGMQEILKKRFHSLPFILLFTEITLKV